MENREIRINATFDSLPDFAKPEMCQTVLNLPVFNLRDRASRLVTVGCNVGDPNIYYTDGVDSGKYQLQGPLEKLSLDDFMKEFSGERGLDQQRSMIMLRIWGEVNSTRRY